MQTIVFFFVILYVLMFLSGGLFTTFYMLIACFVSVFAALLMLMRKSFLCAIVDLAAPGSMFIYFINNA
ncbi:hypothetical protein [Paenibacillus pseudetheri]|uniref:hypothetical protein n=1 Tax=Paenibacillus pseudetheri TaxID=2897682 RepID=UPI001F1AD595|nr:hypothetical protein [Paenibacillus pseudetheri]